MTTESIAATEPVIEPVKPDASQTPASEQTPSSAQPATEQVPEPQEPAKKEEGKWYIDVITGLRHNVREKAQELEALKAENEVLKTKGAQPKVVEPTISLTDAEINRRADELANARVFNEKCDAIAAKGKEEFPSFDGALANLRAVGALGPNVSPSFLQAVSELPQAHKLLNHLGNHPDEAARITTLPPLKMAIELAKIESSISAPKPKAISTAPAPIVPVSGSGGNNNDLSSPDISMEDFARIRSKQREERAKR